ncbi:MAG: glucuronate isomerase [Acidobacteria bacterium]|nr:glucuronate isomerase [Acidobacteriota bacterium]
MPFIHDDFLLSTGTARRLYHTYAKNEPILDYHNHLPPKDLAENRQFANLFEIWLEGDHYKWRAMRANGVAEQYCTGSAAPLEKFQAWARTVPYTLRNPLFHWTHLELVRYFGIEDYLEESSAKAIWDKANALLATDALRVWGILEKFQVKALCTTDDPTDDLAYHVQLKSSGLKTKVFPAFRPDKALRVDDPSMWNAWVDRLGAVSNTDISTLPRLLDALKQRHDFFHSLGGRLSDHGLNHCYASFVSDSDAAAIFNRARAGQAADSTDHARFATYLMLHFGRLDAEKGWTKQLHLGAYRSANTRKLSELGPDTGFDSMGDWNQISELGAYLNALESEGMLPKTILYNVNPVQNMAFATMIGNFQDGSVPGKIQFGSGWWFLDQKEGMEWQMNALSNVGLLSRFVGMLTDSRSFLSFPRHEYFRRTLCNLIGKEIESGEIPDREDWVGPMIRNICYGNASSYLGLDLS